MSDGERSHTARETLATFHPEHGWHCVTSVLPSDFSVALTCSCGAALSVTSRQARDLGWTLDEVKHCLRNAPKAAS